MLQKFFSKIIIKKCVKQSRRMYLYDYFKNFFLDLMENRLPNIWKINIEEIEILFANKEK